MSFTNLATGTGLLTGDTISSSTCAATETIRLSLISHAFQTPKTGTVVAHRERSRDGAFCVSTTSRPVYRVLSWHEVAQEPTGSSEYTGSTTFLRAANRPKEGEGAKGVRSGVSAGTTCRWRAGRAGPYRRIEVRKASQQRKPFMRRCPKALDVGSGGIGQPLIEFRGRQFFTQNNPPVSPRESWWI